jgi:hypothetical protein
VRVNFNDRREACVLSSRRTSGSGNASHGL